MALQNKATLVNQLMHQLENDLANANFDSAKRLQVLEQLKAHGRDPTDAEAIYSKTGITVLSRYAFGGYPSQASQEALRCIANALLLAARLRQVFVDNGSAEKAVHFLRNADDNYEFLVCRILFLLTYETNLDFGKLLLSESLAENIVRQLTRHIKDSDLPREPAASPIEQMAVVETLKLVYNIASTKPENAATLNAAARPVFRILRQTAVPKPPLQPPISVMLNALVYLDLSTSQGGMADQQAQPVWEKQDIVKLMDILDISIKSYKPAQLETQALSLLTVMRQMYSGATLEMKVYMQSILLPAETDRDLPLGQSGSLASRLLRLTVSPGLTSLPEVISAFLFELSEKDANTFVRNVGYGYAAGHLMSHKIPIPKSAKQTSVSSSQQTQIPINPITGQRLDRQPSDTMPQMTREEKEREAERLFVLFERLKANGVIDGKNPVQAAMEEGRFEELSDSDPE